MSERKWTSGPWHLMNAFRGDGMAVRANVRIDCGTYVTQTVADIGSMTEPNIANAHLIAAAPDMAEALDLFLRQWNACGPNSDFGRHFHNVRETAVAALASAKGETP